MRSTPGSPRRRLASRGFTLVELMTVVMLLAIVGAFAAPGLQAFVAGQRAKALAVELNADLLFARSEALKRNAAVTVAHRSTGWDAGWSVASGGVELLSRESAAAAVLFESAPSSITFNVNGRVSSPAGAVRITVYSTANDQAKRCVELDLSGRARAKAGACA
jgi:type IV fimbrial biogenesis protein FimT